LNQLQLSAIVLAITVAMSRDSRSLIEQIDPVET
jgi:hypothetical protein